MKMSKEISRANEEEKEMEQKVQPFSISGPFSSQPQQKLIVGYALTLKKTKSFLQPKLVVLARKKGIIFVAIDRNRPLSDQGPFDIVLHKLSGKEWRQVLELPSVCLLSLVDKATSGVLGKTSRSYGP